MGFSRLEYPYTGGAQDFAVNFSLGYLETDDVKVYVIGEVDGLGDQLFRTYTFLNEGTIRVTDPLPNPCTVVLERTVDKDQLEIDLESNGAVTRVTLVRAFRQLMMNIHELLDGRADAFTGAILDSILGIRDEAQTAREGAETAQANAEASATTAENSAISAASYEATVAASAAAAAASESAAATSASDADADRVAAEAAAAVAQGSADAAAASATSTSADVTAAAASASAAATSETNAANSAAAASSSASAAAASAVAAAADAAILNPASYATAAQGAKADTALQPNTQVTLTGMTVTGVDGVTINPESDVDVDLITVGVTGNPRIYWHEPWDRFQTDRGFRANDFWALDGGFSAFERSASPAIIPGAGVLWVRNDSPNTLMYKDDAGNEYEIAGQGVSSGGGNSNVESYLASGTWTKPEQGTWALIECWGGGGGGADGGSGDPGSGGGGGGYNSRVVLLSDLGATETVTIGAGGSAGGNSPGNGGNTTFGAWLTAYGGAGGAGAGSGETTGGGGGGLYSAASDGVGGSGFPPRNFDGSAEFISGGGSGGAGTNTQGHPSIYGGGGGGSGQENSTDNRQGGYSVYGGGGGGGNRDHSGNGSDGGLSMVGGKGGNGGGRSGYPAEDGQQPGGGGGGASGGGAGNGGDGMVRVTVW